MYVGGQTDGCYRPHQEARDRELRAARTVERRENRPNSRWNGAERARMDKSDSIRFFNFVIHSFPAPSRTGDSSTSAADRPREAPAQRCNSSTASWMKEPISWRLNPPQSQRQTVPGWKNSTAFSPTVSRSLAAVKHISKPRETGAPTSGRNMSSKRERPRRIASDPDLLGFDALHLHARSESCFRPEGS